MHCKLAALLQRVIIDQRSNNLTLVDVLDELRPATLPFVIPQLTALFVVERGAEDPLQADLVVTLLLDDAELVQMPATADFGQKLRVRMIVDIGGLLIQQPGMLRARLSRDGNELASYSVVIMPAAGPQVVTQAG